MKRTVAILLACNLMLSLVACGAKDTVSADTEPSAPALEHNSTPELECTPVPNKEFEENKTEVEIARAVELGLVSEDMLDNPDMAVTHAQFCSMLSTVIEKRYGDVYLEQWKKAAALALGSSDSMIRSDGAMAIFVAALTVGMDDYHSASYKLPDIDGLTSGDGIAGIRERDNWTLFPNAKEPYFNINYEQEYDSQAAGAANYASHRISPVSGLPVMEYTDELSMRFDDLFTCEEAVCAALRLYESWTPREYVKLTDTQANTYNPEIITNELLGRTSNLPEVTGQNLPASWNGLCIYSKGVTHYNMIEPFRERDLRFMSENGFNFARTFLGFTTLGYPDYPEDGALVNLSELEDLDQLIAWGLKYDVHISICMLTPPGYKSQEDVAHQSIKDWDYPSDKQWQLINDYWVMLAKRYANIPNKNLSFELCCEWHLDEKKNDFKKDWEPVVSAIHEVTPDRVLLASFDTAIPMKLALAEDMAEMGVSLAAHPYSPWHLSKGNKQMRESLGFTGELSWPLVWFPSKDFNERISSITIDGTVGGSTISVYVMNDGMAWKDESGEPSVTVYADGVSIGTHTYTDGGAQDALIAEIPADTKEVTISHTSGHLELSCIRMDGTFGSAQLMPHDVGWCSDWAGEAKLMLGADGTWSSADGRYYDGEAYYEEALLPYIELAKQYNVGFMVNEFVFADDEQDTTQPTSFSAQLAYYKEAIRTFKKYNIGCCLNFISNSIGIIWDSPYGYAMWSDYPDYQVQQSYTYDSGRTDTFYICRVLLETIKDALQ